MHVNCIIFLVGAPKYNSLIQCAFIRKKHRERFQEAISIMIQEYRAQGVVNVVGVGTDKAFESIKSEFENKPYQIALTTCDANRHVEVIKIIIGFVREII